MASSHEKHVALFLLPILALLVYSQEQDLQPRGDAGKGSFLLLFHELVTQQFCLRARDSEASAKSRPAEHAERQR